MTLSQRIRGTQLHWDWKNVNNTLALDRDCRVYFGRGDPFLTYCGDWTYVSMSFRWKFSQLHVKFYSDNCYEHNNTHMSTLRKHMVTSQIMMNAELPTAHATKTFLWSSIQNVRLFSELTLYIVLNTPGYVAIICGNIKSSAGAMINCFN